MLDNEHENNLLASSLLTSANYMQKLNNLLNNNDPQSIWSSGSSSTTTTTTLTTSPSFLDHASNYESLLLNENMYSNQQQQQQHNYNAQSLYQTMRSSSSLSSSASSSCSSASVSLSSSQTNCGNLNSFGVFDTNPEQHQQQLYDPFNDLTFLNDRLNSNKQQQQQQQQTFNDASTLFPLVSKGPTLAMQLLQKEPSLQYLFQKPQIISKCFLCNNKIGSNDNQINSSEMITYQTNKLCLNCAQTIAYQQTEQLPL